MPIENRILQWALSQFSSTPLASGDGTEKCLRLAMGLTTTRSASFGLSKKPLVSVFSKITLGPPRGAPASANEFFPMMPLTPDSIVYPANDVGPASGSPQPNELQDASAHDNLALVFLEQYGSFRAICDDENANHIAFHDAVKMGAAIHSCLERGEGEQPFLFLSGDFSGIQNFVYTISSKGALKTLRARSFMLEMLTEHIIYEILEMTGTKRYHIVFSGGGGFTLLLPNTSDTRTQIHAFKQKTNEWLFRIAGGKLNLALQAVPCSEKSLASSLPDVWEDMSNRLDEDKKKRFVELMGTKLFAVKDPRQTTNSPDAEPKFRECDICHRDDVEIEVEGEMRYLEGNSTIACPLCFRLFHIGDDLSERDYHVYRLSREQLEGVTNKKGFLQFSSCNENDVFYLVSSDDLNGYEAKWVKNNWDLALYNKATYPLMIANYVRKHGDLPAKAQDKEEGARDDHTATFEGLASSACGANLLGALRMDVDNLGLVFSQGLHDKLTLAALSTLSRYLNLFFKVCLNRICGGRLDIANEQPLDIVGKNYANNGGRNVSIIYSGGDDLFIIGAWDEITELAFDIYRCFKRLTCTNPFVTISGGVTLHSPNYPLYQMAGLSHRAGTTAKNQKDDAGREVKDSFAMFYNDRWKAMNRKINERVEGVNNSYNRTDDGKDRIALAIRWSIFPTVVNLTNRLSRVSEDLPHGFYQKLFTTIKVWQEDGKLYLPTMHYVLTKIQKSFKDSTPAEFSELMKVLFAVAPEEMKSIHLALHWLEYLNRGTGGKS